MRQEQDYCKRCGSPIEVDMIGKTDICGNCADELNAEEEAMEAQAIAEDEAEARAKWEAEQNDIVPNQ